MGRKGRWSEKDGRMPFGSVGMARFHSCDFIWLKQISVVTMGRLRGLMNRPVDEAGDVIHHGAGNILGTKFTADKGD